MASKYQTSNPGQKNQRETSAGFRLSHPPPSEEVCITGVAGFFPDSANVVELRDNLFNKVDMISDDDRRYKGNHLEIPSRSGKLLEINRFDAEFFGVKPKLADALDPMARILMEKSYEALIDAGVNPCELRNKNIGVFVAASYSETEVKTVYQYLHPNGYGVSGSCRSLLANRISSWLGITGPSYTLDAACSSSLYALDHAYSAIRNGHCEAAIVAGSNLCLSPLLSLQFTKLGVMSSGGKCRSFDNGGDGYVRSETCALIFLQKAKDARRVYAQVVHTKTNCDGHKEQGLTYPGKNGQRMLLTEFYQECEINPSDIEYIEAHGTGTRVGDPEELSTLDEIFCTDKIGPLKIGSVKSNLGHSEAATGLCALAKMCIAYGTGYLPPNLHYEVPLEGVAALKEGRMKVVTEKTLWNKGLAGINSFGIGGSNGHALLKNFTKPTMNNRPAAADSLPRLVCVSGRTLPAVDSFLDDVESKGVDVNQIRLLHAIYDHPIPLHEFRGYTLLRPTAPTSKVSREAKYNPEGKRPIWFVFSGMGSQWAGMGTHLMTLPIFAAAIERCHRVLKPKGLNISQIITDPSPKVFDNILHSMVGIASVQIGICDILKAVGIEPDFIIGHGVGELGCAYADRCLTQEQVILAAYSRGLVSLKASTIKGAMADVGLGYQQVKAFCPSDIEVTCHNSPESCTISGPEESMKTFVSQLQGSGVFTKDVPCSNIAYHSKHKTEAGDNLLKFLRQVIPEPKLRSNRWVSSSVPQNLWGEEQAKYSSAEYHINNALNPVLFEETSHLIHSNAITIEIAPDGLVQSILKKSTKKDCSHIALTQKGNKNTIEFLLTAIGRLYLLGLNPKLANLYPKVEFPVPAETSMLSHLVKWDHRVDWFVASYENQTVLSKGERLIEKNISDEATEFMNGHIIDGRNLYPATGYLEMVWETLAMMKGKVYQEVAVVFENVRFQRATNIPKDGALEFSVMIQKGSGNFEIMEGGTAIVTGKIYQKVDVYRDFYQIKEPTKGSGESINTLNKRETYKELRLRGYNYSGQFRGIQSCSVDGCTGVVNWINNWITYLDTLMQVKILTIDSRGLFVPTRIEKISIDPWKHYTIMSAIPDVGGTKTIPVFINDKINIIRSGGVEIRGLTATPITKRNPLEVPVVEKHTFVPFFPKYKIKTEEAIRVCTQLVLENVPSIKVKVLELLDSGTVAGSIPLAASVKASLEDTPLIQVDMLVMTKDKDLDLGPGIKVENTNVLLETNVAIFVGSRLLGRGEVLQQAIGTLKENGFLISREDLKFNADAIPNHLDIISSINLVQERLVLFKRKARAQLANFVDIKGNDEKFSWIDNLKSLLTGTDHLVLVAQKEPLNGILGLVNCLRREPGGEKVSCINIMDPKAPDFNPDIELYKEQLQKNLGVNVFKNGEWGTYRHLLLEDLGTVLTDHAFVNVTSRGDMSSLRWIQGNLDPKTDKQIVHVYYAALNFRDVMTATGRIPPETVAKGRLAQECVQGMEYSGRMESGHRVMGIISCGAMSNLVTVDKHLLWPVPEKWSLEEGATVPIVYGTVYYALMLKGNMQPGSTVLIHAGSGGVGQAAIHVCLFYGCTIYTTVGTAEKRIFIKKLFPTLTDQHIGNSRDTSFEELVMRQTKGKGVDIVLNSLADDKLQASVRCLGYRGRFLEIGKFDIVNNSSLGMHFFSRECSFYGVMLDTLLDRDSNDKQKLQKILDDGIKNGCIKPLSRISFGTDEVEKAFRYMAAGKHIGKVLLKIREEEPERSIKPKVLRIQAIPRYICNSEYSYVIAGGLGGFGLELVDWLVLQGAKKLVLNSRRGITSGYQSARIRAWKSYGVETVISTDDITTQTGCASLLKTANTLAPVRAIFNLAVILKDALMQNQTPETFEISFGPKARATKFLDTESRKMCPELKQFVIFSSVSCGRGNAGQTNYGMANSVMERICEERHKERLPALAVQWGVVGDVGLVADMQEEHFEMEIGGTLQQRISCCLKTLDQLLGQSSPVVSSMVVAEKRFEGTGEMNIQDTVAAIMGLRDLKTVSLQATLVDLGMDSMMTVEIKQCLERDFEVFLTAEDIRTLTFSKLSDYAAHQEVKPVIPAVEGAPNNTTVFDNLVRTIGDEANARKPFVNMATLTSDGKEEKLRMNEPRIFMIPGIEGTSNIFTDLCARIQYMVTVLQPGIDNKDQSIEGIAQRLLVTVRSCLPPKAPFIVLGYSFGACVAVEMIKLLEDEGHLGILICIDASPQWLKAISKLFAVDEHSLQDRLLNHISSILTTNQSISIAAELAACTTWESKVEVFIESIPSRVKHSKSYQRTMVNLFYGRLKAINNYDTFWSRKLRSETILIRTKHIMPGLEIEEHYGLQELLGRPLELHYIEAHHDNIVNHENCAKIINKIVMNSSMLEAVVM